MRRDGAEVRPVSHVVRVLRGQLFQDPVGLIPAFHKVERVSQVLLKVSLLRGGPRFDPANPPLQDGLRFLAVAVRAQVEADLRQIVHE